MELKKSSSTKQWNFICCYIATGKVTEAASQVREMLQGQLHNENDEDLDEEDEDEDEDHAMELDSDMVNFFLVSNNLCSYMQNNARPNSN